MSADEYVSEDEYPALQPVVGRGAMFVEHRLKNPRVSQSAYVAPTAVLCGDVTVGPHSRVLFGAVITAEGGPVEIGRNCAIMGPLDYPGTVFGVGASDADSIMPDVARRYARALALHNRDHVLPDDRHMLP